MDEYFNYNNKKFKDKKYYSKRPSHYQSNISYNNNILQFSLNAINSIIVKTLNSSIGLGMINITNNIPKNKNQIINNNVYMNSINDCIDNKLKGNIHKTSQEELLYLYPNIENIITNISKKELKILKFDKEKLISQAKTPTKKSFKNFYFNLMKNNNININITNNENFEDYGGKDNFRHSHKNSADISNEYKLKKIKNNNYYIYRTYTTINSKEKNNDKYINDINTDRNSYKKKISPNKKYIINKNKINYKDSIKEKQNININISPTNNITNKKFVYKIADNKTKKLIIYKKNKDKINITNISKPKKYSNNNNLKTNLNYDIKNISSKYNSLPYNNKNDSKNNIQNNLQNNENISPRTTRNINYNKNKKILYLNNNINRNKLLLTPNKNINKTENKIKTSKNKNLNIQYNPTISNNIYRGSSNNKHQIKGEEKTAKKPFPINYRTINNEDKELQNKKIFLYKKVKTANNNKYNTKTFEINNLKKKNTVFDNDENSIFKILDNTQIIAPDECRYSLNSNNKLHHQSGSRSNSNGNNTNQDTEYNSIKKFSNNYMMNEYNDNYNNYQYMDNLNNNENFSFNNM